MEDGESFTKFYTIENLGKMFHNLNMLILYLFDQRAFFFQRL